MNSEVSIFASNDEQEIFQAKNRLNEIGISSKILIVNHSLNPDISTKENRVDIFFKYNLLVEFTQEDISITHLNSYEDSKIESMPIEDEIEQKVKNENFNAGNKFFTIGKIVVISLILGWIVRTWVEVIEIKNKSKKKLYFILSIFVTLSWIFLATLNFKNSNLSWNEALSYGLIVLGIYNATISSIDAIITKNLKVFIGLLICIATIVVSFLIPLVIGK